MKPVRDTQDLATQITVHRLCSDFERKWQIGERPAIENYLGRVDADTQPQLLASLLESEVEIRIDRGELPTRDEYRQRFAASPAVVDQTFDELQASQPTPTGVAANELRIAHYQIVHEIARGGMGVVYRAVDERLGRTVALKVILSGHLASKAEVQRFEIEARTVAKLDHPGIVPVFEVGQWAGHRYLTMPLVEGQNLADVIDQRPSPIQAAELLRQIAVAIDFAHAAGIVHRDLKPRNVLLDASGRTRVTDFGLAKVVHPSTVEAETLADRKNQEITATGQILGTPCYMSPEQAAGQEAGSTTDIYSLGAVLYELLTGQPPFNATSVVEMLQQIQNWSPISPRNLNPKTPRDLATICLKCLEKDPRQRYAAARNLQEDLDRFLSGRPVLARHIGPVGRLQRWSQRNPVIAGLLASIGLLVGTALVALTMMNLRVRDESREKSRALHQASVAKRNAEQAEVETKNALVAKTDALKRARDALDTLTDNVVEKLLAGEPSLDDNEKAFLHKVAELYEPFSNAELNLATSDTPGSRANALFRLGSIHHTLGNYDKAQKSLEQAERLLMEGAIDTPDTRVRLAEVRKSLAALMSNSGDEAAAIEVMRREVSELETLVDRFPADVQIKAALAVSCLNLVIILHPSPATLDECEALTRKAQPHLEAEARDPDCAPRVLLYLSSCYNNLGVLAGMREDNISAESNLNLALSARRRLLARQPNDIETQAYLGNTLVNLAQLQLKRDGRDEADASFTNAIDALEKVVRQEPGNPVYRQRLASFTALHGEMWMDDQPETAISKFDRALAILAVDAPPGALAAIARKMVIGIQRRRATSLDRLQRTEEADAAWEQVTRLTPYDEQAEVQLSRAFSLVRSGDYRRAIEITELVARDEDLSENDTYNGACVLALASAAATAEPEIQDRSALQSVELLRRLNVSYFDSAQRKHMKHDPDLDSLRERTDYREFLEELEANVSSSQRP